MVVGTYLPDGRIPGLPSVITLFVIISFITTFLYRRHFHPLAHFPGPAAATLSSRWLYKQLMTGHAEEALEELHARYRTRALRIGPNELHISDPELYKTIYSQYKPFPKYAPFYDAFDGPHTIFTEVDPELHKERRDLLKPFFSHGTLLKIEGLIQQRAVVLVNKIAPLSKTQSSIDIIQAIRCLIFDVTIRFSFAASSNLIEEKQDSFQASVVNTFDSLGARPYKNAQWPLPQKTAAWTPRALTHMVHPQDANFLDVISLARKCVTQYETEKNSTSHPVIFDHLQSLSPNEKISEAVDLLFAGSDTTATSLTTGIMYILLDPDVHRKVVDALNDVDPDEHGYFPLQRLEKVNYLVACVKESIRMAVGVPGRLPRVVPSNPGRPFMVDGQIVPAGAVVSISAYTMNFSEEQWGPDARSFNPDRWLQDGSENLSQYLCSFSKGRRMCIGQNVASAEILILLAYLFKSFKLSFLPDFQMPERKDQFVTRFSTGLPVHFEKI
ncbi:hypothetical protein FE257_011330 [Aspergillus nanangensis]|uniref:Cytochrome P450 n=1 Tax=Aspergillus nanangensis TaxID=2582783 RepID=A0AAD4GSM5_ASPNN|nr:hypothetical protein FE257_011330 [Aspergillus nanangensis]